MAFQLSTPRMILREWRDGDGNAFAAMFQDPEVMEFLLPVDGRAGVDTVIGRIMAHQAKHGFCWWAAELPGIAPFIGFIGLEHVTFSAHFTPAIEIGWRLARPFWGCGYATEGAAAALEAAFTRFGAKEVVSMAVPANRRSWRVMERLHMTRDPQDDFDHPGLPEGHPWRRHVLYRMSLGRWNELPSHSG
jgi:ribosomal-protein-alanine N-acetyltransferase